MLDHANYMAPIRQHELQVTQIIQIIQIRKVSDLNDLELEVGIGDLPHVAKYSQRLSDVRGRRANRRTSEKTPGGIHVSPVVALCMRVSHQQKNS